MEIFEYRIKRVNCGLFKGDEELNKVLKHHGDNGWELISTHYHWWSSDYDLFFKRKIRKSNDISNV